MKKAFIPLLVGMIAASGPSWAWSKVNGSITNIDQNAHQITLNNGRTYSTESDVNLANLATGDKVTVTAEAKAGKNIASKVTKRG